MKIILTSTGRAGSRFVHNTLAGSGLELGKHEANLGRDGGALNFGFLSREHFDILSNSTEYYKIHLVRNPLECIASLTTTNSYKGPVNRNNSIFNTELNSEPDPLRRSMMYYYNVNLHLLSEYKFDLLFNLEKYKEHFIEMSSIFPAIDSNKLDQMLTQYGTTHNSRKHAEYSWKDLENKDKVLTLAIQELSIQLGY